MSKGTERVGLGFNPSGNPEVGEFKQIVADLIDRLEIYQDQGAEIGRCASIAQTKLEEACMWAVKTITK